MSSTSNDIGVSNEPARMLQNLLGSLNGIAYRSRVDEHWTMEFISDGCKQLTGYAPEDLLFNRLTSYEAITHEEDQQRVRDEIHAALATRSRFELEYRLRRADGEIRWVSERGAGVWADTGELIGIEGIVYDISERKQAEVASREAERRYQSLFINASEGIFRTSLSGRYLEANPALARIYGFESPTALIEWFSDIGSQLYVQPTRRQEFRELVQREGSVSNFESEVYRRDGTVIWISESAHPVLDDEGQVIGYEGMVEDITDRKRYQQSLIAAREAAEAANQAKSQFLANMSHEIRTPMNGILGMVDLLLDTPLDRTQSDYATTIRASATSLLSIINDLLDFSKIEAGKMELESIEFSARELLEDVAVVTAAQAVAKGLEVITKIAPDVPEVVLGDAQRLKQCLINLTGNAVKFSTQGEIIIGLSCRRSALGDTVLLFEVCDSGIGISQEAIQSLFQPFVQADSSTTRRFGGTGLGLSIVHRLVSMMNGNVGVDSEPGVGSRFWFEIPCASKHSAAHITPAATSLGRILVVDSSIAQCESLTSQLQNAGYEAEWRGSSTAALAHMRRAADSGMPFDVVLAAMQAPGEPCAGLVDLIHNDLLLARSRVVMLTPLDRHEDIERLEDLGCAGYLTKPVRASELFACLRKVLASESREWHMQSQRLQKRRKPLGRLEVGEQRPRALVVEDNLVNQKVAQRFLERLGLEVIVANNGAEAIERYSREPVDVIFMDLQMPVMGGIEATQEIRSMEGTGRRTPIIALTAHAIAGELERCLAAGMDDFLTKPLIIERLQAVLSKYCGLEPAESTVPIPRQTA